MSPDKEAALNNQQTICPLRSGIPENWTWNILDKSSEVILRGVDRAAAHFPPELEHRDSWKYAGIDPSTEGFTTGR